MIVVDATVLVTALADAGSDGGSARARLADEQLAAPEIIDLEVVSALRRLSAAERLDVDRATAAVEDLVAFPLRRVANRPLLHRCWELRGNLTPYDAAYVALAERLDATLLTADRRVTDAPGTRCRFEILG